MNIKLDNLRAVIKNLFCYISPVEIIKENVTYDNINENTFVKLGSGYIDRYTNDEIRNMYNYLENEFHWQNCKLKNIKSQNFANIQLNVFDALTTFNYSILIEENGEPLCQYQNLLRWRDMITVLEEDLFNTSFLAMQDVLRGKSRYNFFWKPVIGHNNYALNKLVAKGLAENHFHLKGSAPQFHLSWLSIMNDVKNSKFEKVLREYDGNKLQKNIVYDVEYRSDSLVVMWRQAALIRLFLFSELCSENLEFEHMNMPYEMFLSLCNDEDRDNIKNRYIYNYEDIIDVSQYLNELSNTSVYKVKKAYAEKQVNEMIKDYEILESNLDVIQNNICRISDMHAKSKYDYVICESWLVKNPNYSLNEVISGERWFMYSMFKKMYSRDIEWGKYMNWFYLYLVLKANIRMELVQANKTVGFDNFRNYQDRKEQLIEDTIYEPIYVKMALRDTILNQHIISLEARIAPKPTAEKLRKAIDKYDRWACDGLEQSDKEKIMEKYFYVVHFVKEKDKYEIGKCRHYCKRRELEKQARAIAQIRDDGCLESERIHGIDACSVEIGCRPEVFAHTFRYLKAHSPNQKFKNGIVDDGLMKNRTLMATYHVGEDFLDVIDGLRAIDEAIVFLNMRCGDRLGHALALGINIDDWYKSKSNRILISKQDYLDNLVWLHAKIRKYCISDCSDALLYIEKRFSEYFSDIYLNYMHKEIRGDFEGNHKIDNNLIGVDYYNLNFGINEYYDSWKLRGDEPELYRTGKFVADDLQLDDWNYNAINRLYPQNYTIRYNLETSILYYMYHYNSDVVKKGSQMVEIKVKPCIIEAVKKVRIEMQKDIARMGIGIETNPSSNYFIGTFRRYDKHPIVDWHNRGLTYDKKLLRACPQLQVSINTDDQGVFATYIENEYAYMALALEKSKNENGEYLYNRADILQWLENIRNMGIDQSFN